MTDSWCNRQAGLNPRPCLLLVCVPRLCNALSLSMCFKPSISTCVCMCVSIKALLANNPWASKVCWYLWIKFCRAISTIKQMHDWWAGCFWPMTKEGSVYNAERLCSSPQVLLMLWPSWSLVPQQKEEDVAYQSFQSFLFLKRDNFLCHEHKAGNLDKQVPTWACWSAGRGHWLSTELISMLGNSKWQISQ